MHSGYRSQSAFQNYIQNNSTAPCTIQSEKALINSKVQLINFVLEIMYNIDREINFHQHICSCTHRSINRKHYHKITNSNNWREFRKSVDTYIAPILHLDGMFSSTASAYEKLTSSLSSCSTAFFFIISEEFGTSPGSRADTKFIYVVCFQQTNFSLKDITGSLEITP